MKKTLLLVGIFGMPLRRENSSEGDGTSPVRNKRAKSRQGGVARLFGSWLFILSALTGLMTYAFAQNTTLDEAKQFFDRGEFNKAAPIYEKLAAEGDALAQYTLAEMYFRGMGVQQDIKKAAALYELAAEKNIMHAQQNIAVLYMQGTGVTQNFERALFWFRKAAAQGDSFAQYSIGLRYLNGEGVEQNSSEALSWFKKAAEQGFTQAFWQIGLLYAQGKGVPRDLKEAAAWTRRAAENGYPPAQRTLGFAYLYGQGVQRDVVQAYKWLVISEDMSGGPIDLSNPNWEPNMGSFALGVREQFKKRISREQIKKGEEEVRNWLATHR